MPRVLEGGRLSEGDEWYRDWCKRIRSRGKNIGYYEDGETLFFSHYESDENSREFRVYDVSHDYTKNCVFVGITLIGGDGMLMKEPKFNGLETAGRAGEVELSYQEQFMDLNVYDFLTTEENVPARILKAIVQKKVKDKFMGISVNEFLNIDNSVLARGIRNVGPSTIKQVKSLIVKKNQHVERSRYDYIKVNNRRKGNDISIIDILVKGKPGNFLGNFLMDNYSSDDSYRGGGVEQLINDIESGYILKFRGIGRKRYSELVKILNDNFEIDLRPYSW